MKTSEYFLVRLSVYGSRLICVVVIGREKGQANVGVFYFSLPGLFSNSYCWRKWRSSKKNSGGTAFKFETLGFFFLFFFNEFIFERRY